MSPGKPARSILAFGLAAASAAPPLSAQNATGQQADTVAIRQQIEGRLGRSVSQGEILEALRRSGLTRSQLRLRLSQAGYDPALADRYYDALEGGSLQRGAPGGDFAEALGRLGLMGQDSGLGIGPGQAALFDSLGADSRPFRDPPGLPFDLRDEPVPTVDGLPIFGHDIFRRFTTQFDPILEGPVDAGYRLDAGDELALVLTGDVELAYPLTVSREGHVFIPDVGRVAVAGLTLGQLEDALYGRLGSVYSGVRRGPGATTRFQISVGRLRVNQVFVVGEVRWPGAYQVNAAGTAFNALYLSGGPSAAGSLRSLEVRRGGRLVQTVDTYDYLLRGDNAGDLRLEQGDRLFVPVALTLVGVEGSVRRPAAYELREGEGLRELIAFAGGFRSDAVVRRIQVDRVVPPWERIPGVDRVLVDVDLRELMEGDEAMPLRDGDRVRVFAISDERRNRVVLEGEVNRPGLYQWSDGETLQGLIDRAEGLTEGAYLSRAHIYRLDPADGRRQLLRVALSEDGVTGDVRLADRDSVVIFSKEMLRNESVVTVDGFVKDPGEFPLAEGMTLEDLILAAGGFVRGAYALEVEIARPVDPLRRDRTLATVFRVALPPGGAPGSDGGSDGATGAVEAGAGDWRPLAAEFSLRHGDRAFVRRAPGYEVSRTVAVTGQIHLPGRYVLAERDETVSSIIARAGGLTTEAYAPGFQMIREGELVATDLSRALVEGDREADLALAGGDSLHVPAYDPTVLVRGAVAFETRVLYESGENIDYYIEQAGGYLDNADRDRVSVTFQNGSRATKRTRFLLPDGVPRPGPGSRVVVPVKPPRSGGLGFSTIFTQTLTALTAAASLIIAVDRISN
ncbi:MAG: SLBB domain-containing protein [Gemmatimonadota bacterium]